MFRMKTQPWLRLLYFIFILTSVNCLIISLLQKAFQDMSQKVEVSSPFQNKKTNQEDNHESEFEEMTQKVLKNPSMIQSFPSENFDSPTPKVQKRNSIFFKKKSKDDLRDERLYDEVKNKKISLLKYKFDTAINKVLETIQ